MTERPNVVFVLTDDQGYGDLSCMGNPVLRTPHMDRLHAESVRFTDFHVQPVCTPTRGELMSGCHAMRNRATFVCMGRSLMRADLPTVADVFAANGYRTGHFGKWHLGDNYPYRPQDRGFQETLHHPAWGITSAPDYWCNDYFDDTYRRGDAPEQCTGYCTDVWFAEALKWMESCRRDGEPFFTYIATNAPHSPHWVPDEYRRPYLDRVTHPQASFFGMIANIDENLERLDAYLDESGLRENTVLVFMSDNGTATGMNVYNAGMRGKKASLYEGGHRVPFFVRWPAGGVGGGRDIDMLSRATDLMPTLIDLCALTVDDDLSLDGRSLAPLLLDADATLPERTEIIQFGHTNPDRWCSTREGNAAVLRGPWRLVDGTELYDIRTDPGQERDIAADHPDIVAQLRDAYAAWWAQHGAALEEYEPIIIGSDRQNPTRLCSSDWAWVYADQQKQVRQPVEGSGTWHVDVEREGTYAFTLHRWPEEAGLAITDPAPLMQGVDGTLPEGVAVPAASARLHVGDAEWTQPVSDGATGVTFELPLPPGRTQIRTWWLAADGSPITGANYLTAERLR